MGAGDGQEGELTPACYSGQPVLLALFQFFWVMEVFNLPRKFRSIPSVAQWHVGTPLLHMPASVFGMTNGAFANMNVSTQNGDIL